MKTWLMIGAMFLLLAIVVMVSLKWLTVGDADGKTTITIDRNEIKQDVQEALGQGKGVLQDAGKNLKIDVGGDTNPKKTDPSP
jgi:hypothetical protein